MSSKYESREDPGMHNGLLAVIIIIIIIIIVTQALILTFCF